MKNRKLFYIKKLTDATRVVLHGVACRILFQKKGSRKLIGEVKSGRCTYAFIFTVELVTDIK